MSRDLDFEAEFERAWANPRYTRFQQSDIDINGVLAERYELGQPLVFTRSLLWDLEVRKAASPARYIPYVVEAGSARSWGRRAAHGGGEYLDRCSRQRLWMRPEERALVLERAFLNHREQRVTFLGVPVLGTDEGRLLKADRMQPLFHVEHSVGGEEERPTNRWRIVHLTERPDGSILDRFHSITQEPWLPEYVEIYIRDDLGIELARRSR